MHILIFSHTIYKLCYTLPWNSVESLGPSKVMWEDVFACLFSSPCWVSPTLYWPVHCGPWWPLWCLSISWGRPMACAYPLLHCYDSHYTYSACLIHLPTDDYFCFCFFINTYVYLLPSSTSMQSIQNLGLALIAMAAGTILDTRGYLVLEVFFCACICGQYFLSRLCEFLTLQSFKLLLDTSELTLSVIFHIVFPMSFLQLHW